MPNTPLGIPMPDDSERVSTTARWMRDGFTKVDQLIQQFQTSGASRGVLPDGTDLDNLTGSQSYGIWMLDASFTYGNLPAPLSQNGILEVMPASLLRTVQRVTEYNKEHFRTSPAGLWGNWRTNVTQEELEVSALMIDQGILPDGTNLNTLIDAEHSGVWVMDSSFTYPNSPVPNPAQNMILVVIVGAGRRVQQRVSENFREHFRTSPQGLFGNWRTNATTEITDPLNDRLTALEQTSGVAIKSKEAVLMRADGSTDFEKAADTLDIPASMTKMLTMWLARQTINNVRLDENVTLTANDALDGSLPQLQAGDVLTFRELFYLAALPSHNVAAELLANRVGAELPGTGAPRDKFIAAMNGTVQGWGWTGANFTTASGLGTANKATARQMAGLLWRIHNEDTTLLGIMGELTHTVTITGANARTFTIDHSIPVNGDPGFPEFVAGKTGTLTNIIGNVAMMVNTRGTKRVLVTMGALPPNDRYPDARRILDTLGLTDLKINGVDTSALNAHVRIANTNGMISLSIAAATFPTGNLTAAIPAGFRPSGFSYGVLTVRDVTTQPSGTKTVEATIQANGTLTIRGHDATEQLRGMITWPKA